MSESTQTFEYDIPRQTSGASGVFPASAVVDAVNAIRDPASRREAIDRLREELSTEYLFLTPDGYLSSGNGSKAW